MNNTSNIEDTGKFENKNKVKIYFLIFISNLMINLDHGIIPAASIKIQKSLDMSDEQLGLLGSLVYAGIVVMGVLVGPLFLRYSPKIIIEVSMFMMMVTLALFTLEINQIYVYYILRFLTGAAQAPMLVYFPVWVDNNGGKEKTIWLTLLQGGVPFGVFSGYVMSSIISSQWVWQGSFYIQIIIMCPCLMGYILMSSKSFDLRYQDKVLPHNDSEQALEIIVKPVEVDYSKQSYFKLLQILFKSKVYMCVMLSICVLFFIITGIQFWISNYMETILNEPQNLVNTIFAVVSLTAPTLGCLFGGITVQYTGGYESKFALPICLGFTTISMAVSLPIPFISNIWVVSTLIWLLLFCGGAQVPPLTGIMISSVHPSLRAFANANTTTFVNLFGFLPAPTVFGFISEQVNKKTAMIFLMWYVIAGFLFQALGVYFQFRDRKNRKSRKLISTKISQFKVTSSEAYEQNQVANISNIVENDYQSSGVVHITQSPLRLRLGQCQKPEGGTYLLSEPEDKYDEDQYVSKQTFEFHAVSINPDIGAFINSEIIAISQRLISDFQLGHSKANENTILEQI